MAEIDPGTSEAKQILEGISAVAAERRREAQPALERPLPDWLLEVVQTEVVCTINPRLLPTKLTSFTALCELLKEKYSIHFVRPDLGPIRTDPMSDDQLGTALLRSDERVRFEEGKFVRTATDFDVIRFININFETIHVGVRGVSKIAELVVAEVAEMIWAAAGAQKRWDDIKAGIALQGYATSTLVDFGVPFENLLATEFREWFSTHMLAGERFALETARRSTRYQFGVSPGLAVVWGLDDVTIKLFLFDTVTGRTETTRLQLGVTARDLMRTGRIRVYSELPFPKHIECLATLRTALAAEPA